MDSLLIKFSFNSNQILRSLSFKDKDWFLNLCEDRSYDKGNVLFYEGSIPTGVFIIESGMAKKYTRGLDGQDQIIYIYEPGDMLGHHALLGKERYQDSCMAMVNLKVKFISESNFNKGLRKVPSLNELIIQNISHEFGVLVNTMALLAQQNIKNRLIVFLLVLNHKFKDKGIDISRQDLSNLVGTSKESLGRSLKELKDTKVIRIEKKLIFLENKELTYQSILK